MACASRLFPTPGGPIISKLCPPLAAIVSARLAFSWPLISEKSGAEISSCAGVSKTVLLGASSFWEGIDVVGDALSVLVITRLPFAVPTDPVIAARSELFDEPFGQYSLPQAILKFRQGFGRLIRSQTDRGVVLVLDRRVQSKSYGQLILKSLPPCQFKTTTLLEVPRLAAGQ